MKNKLLIPNRYKIIGWLMFAITTVIFIISSRIEWAPAILNVSYTHRGHVLQTNVLKEFLFTMWMIGLFMIAFSKEKNEDEYISYLRLSSWQYSIFASMAISIIGTWSIWGLNYIGFSALNMLTAPLAFIVIFNTTIYLTSRRSTFNEE